MTSKKFVIAVGATCLLAALAAHARAEIITSSNVKHIKTILLDHSKVSVVSGLSFDPSYRIGGAGDYDRVFMLNRTSSTTTRGLFWSYLSAESTSSRVAVTGGSSSGDPTDVVADSSGNVYAVFYSASSVEKVADPTGTPVQTQMLGNYNGAGDDDPVSIDMMPSNFGLAGYGAGDLLMFDNGMSKDAASSDLTDALVAIKGDGSKTYQVIWSKTETADQYYRGVANPMDGRYYFANPVAPPTVTLGGTTYPTIYRVGSNGVRETVAMNLPTGWKFDDAMAVNPTDGSIWIVRNEDGTAQRSVARVDAASAVDQGGDVYLAPASVEITWEGIAFDAGLNTACISPDGKYLVVGSLTTTTGGTVNDRLAVFVIPEPSSCLLLSVGLASLAMFRRRS